MLIIFTFYQSFFVINVWKIKNLSIFVKEIEMKITFFSDISSYFELREHKTIKKL